MASSSQELRPDTTGNTKCPESEMRREPQNSSLPVPRFQSGGRLCDTILVELILPVVWLIIRDSRFWNCIWENFLALLNFKAGKSTSRLKYAQKTADPHLTMHWIKEVEIAKSIDELNDIAIDCGTKRFPRLRYAWGEWLHLHWKDFSTSIFISAKQ